MTDKFTNVTAAAKANVYFDGKVVSHSITLADGQRKTLGIIFPGSYSFNTDSPEVMDITHGSCRVKLAGQSEWKAYSAGTGFHVPGHSSFEIAADAICQYICSFEAPK